MMYAELRIGNYIVYERKTCLVTTPYLIWSIQKVPSLAEPLLLNAGIVLKAGFVKTENFNLEPVADEYKLIVPVDNMNIHQFVFLVRRVGNSCFCSFQVNGVCAGENFNAMHELQNLYYFLTKTELKIHL